MHSPSLNPPGTADSSRLGLESYRVFVAVAGITIPVSVARRTAMAAIRRRFGHHGRAFASFGNLKD